MKKFDIIIINPPYNNKLIHKSVIKKVRTYSKRIVAIIPAKDGDIPLQLFNCKNKMKLKIYSYNADEDFLVEKFAKYPSSEFFVSVPNRCYGLKKFFETGEYISVDKNDSEYYYTFSFFNREDLELFKERLFSEKNTLSKGGSICPQYNEILQGIPYIKTYRTI